MDVNVLWGKWDVLRRKNISTETLKGFQGSKLLLVLLSLSRICITVSLTEGRVKQPSVSPTIIYNFLLNRWVKLLF